MVDCGLYTDTHYRLFKYVGSWRHYQNRDGPTPRGMHPAPHHSAYWYWCFFETTYLWSARGGWTTDKLLVCQWLVRHKWAVYQYHEGPALGAVLLYTIPWYVYFFICCCGNRVHTNESKVNISWNFTTLPNNFLTHCISQLPRRSPTIPPATPTVLIFFIYDWVDKSLILRSWKQGPMIGATMSKLSSTFSNFVLLLMPS